MPDCTQAHLSSSLLQANSLCSAAAAVLLSLAVSPCKHFQVKRVKVCKPLFWHRLWFIIVSNNEAFFTKLLNTFNSKTQISCSGAEKFPF